MVCFIVSTLVALLLFAALGFESGAPNNGSSLGWLAVFLAGGLLLGAVLVGASNFVAACAAETEWELVESREICALNDNTGVSGRLYLGFGQADDEMKYCFVEETEKGKVVSSISAQKAYIVESDAETPRIEKWEKRWTNDVWFGFTFTHGPNACEYKIYIPKNSVVAEFNVGLSSGSVVPHSPTSTAPTTITNHCSSSSRALGASDMLCAVCGALQSRSHSCLSSRKCLDWDSLLSLPWHKS